MIEIPIKEWEQIPKQLKSKTPLTKLWQYYWTNPADKSQPVWITETINFIILDKEGE